MYHIQALANVCLGGRQDNADHLYKDEAVRMLLVLASLAAVVGVATPAQADPAGNPDANFLAALDQAGVPYKNSAVAIRVGKKACELMDQGSLGRRRHSERVGGERIHDVGRNSLHDQRGERLLPPTSRGTDHRATADSVGHVDRPRISVARATGGLGTPDPYRKMKTMWPDWWMIPIGIVGALAVIWLILAVTLWLVRPKANLQDLIRLLPDVLRLLERSPPIPNCRGESGLCWLR